MTRASRSFRAAPIQRLGPAAEREARIDGLRAAERRIAIVARVLDDLVRIPGTSRRVGLEPIMGLVPWLGDIVSAVIGAWIVLEARRYGMPGAVVARMIAHVVIDLVVGLVPVIGDLFDFAFKSNSRNLALFRRHALDPQASTTGDRAFLAGLVLLLLGIVWLAVIAVQALLDAVARAI
jgi:hypothetical protein